MLEWLVSTTLLDKKPVALIVVAAEGSFAYALLKRILNTFTADLSPGSNFHIRGIKGKVQNRQVQCIDTRKKIEDVIKHLQQRIRHSEE